MQQSLLAHTAHMLVLLSGTLFSYLPPFPGFLPYYRPWHRCLFLQEAFPDSPQIWVRRSHRILYFSHHSPYYDYLVQCFPSRWKACWEWGCPQHLAHGIYFWIHTHTHTHTHTHSHTRYYTLWEQIIVEIYIVRILLSHLESMSIGPKSSRHSGGAVNANLPMWQFCLSQDGYSLRIY